MKKTVVLIMLLTGINSNFCNYEKYIKTYCNKNNLIATGAGFVAFYALYKGLINLKEARNDSITMQKRKEFDAISKQYNVIHTIDMPRIKSQKFEHYMYGSCWVGIAMVSGIAAWYFARN